MCPSIHHYGRWSAAHKAKGPEACHIGIDQASEESAQLMLSGWRLESVATSMQMKEEREPVLKNEE